MINYTRYRKKTIGIESLVYDYMVVNEPDILKSIIEKKYEIFLYIRRKYNNRHDKHPLLTQKLLETHHFSCIMLFCPYQEGMRQIIKDKNIPLLHIENGMAPFSIQVDRSGLWNDSSIHGTLQKEIQEHSTDKHYEWFKNYSKYVISKNYSKIEQPNSHTKIKEPYIFLPAQKTTDLSIINFYEFDYEHFVKEVTNFCKHNNILLVIKKHPIMNRLPKWKHERKKIDKIIQKSKNKYSKIKVVNHSTHSLCRNAMLTVGINTDVAFDSFINNCPIIECGGSIFNKTNAIIYNKDIQKGLTTFFELNKEKKQNMINEQKSIVYYLYNKYLLLRKDTHNSELTNKEKVVKQLEIIEKQFTSN